MDLYLYLCVSLWPNKRMSTLQSYITGYAFSILLTLLAFGLAAGHVRVLAVFVVLAVLQLLVQLFFFLHIGRGQRSRWNTVTLGVTLFMVTVIVGGTLWVMQNLKHTQTRNNFINGVITAQNAND